MNFDLLALLSKRIRRAPCGLVRFPIETSSNRFANNDGQHFAYGLVRQTGCPWHSDLWQSYCSPFRRVQLQLEISFPPRSSRLLLAKFFHDIFGQKFYFLIHLQLENFVNANTLLHAMI